MSKKRAHHEVVFEELASEMKSGKKPGKILELLDQIQHEHINVDFSQAIDACGNTLLINSIHNALNLKKRDEFIQVANKLLDVDTKHIMAKINNQHHVNPLFCAILLQDNDLCLRLIPLCDLTAKISIAGYEGTTVTVTTLMMACRVMKRHCIEATVKLIQTLNEHHPSILSYSNELNETALITICKGVCDSDEDEIVPLELIKTGHSDPGAISTSFFNDLQQTTFALCIEQHFWNTAIQLCKTPHSRVDYIWKYDIEYFDSEFHSYTALDIMFKERDFYYLHNELNYLIKPSEIELLTILLNHYYEKSLTTNDAIWTTLSHRYIRHCCSVPFLRKIVNKKFGKAWVDRMCKDTETVYATSASFATEQPNGRLTLHHPYSVGDEYDPRHDAHPGYIIYDAHPVSQTRRRRRHHDPAARELPSAYARPATPEDDDYQYLDPSEEYQRRFLPVAGRKSGGKSTRRRRFT